MSVERPTFHEAWHRVAAVRPRLRPGVRVQRVVFRGERWHVLEDPASGQFIRLNSSAYRLIAVLDGRRTIAEAWRHALADQGDDAPTQGEVVGLLGQLYGANLLAADVPGETAALLRRLQKRTGHELAGRLTGLLAVRVPPRRSARDSLAAC